MQKVTSNEVTDKLGDTERRLLNNDAAFGLIHLQYMNGVKLG